MADVTSSRDRSEGPGRDRGQLILVTGLLVAVAVVALVLLLNTAIYTENLASRGADQSGREAMEYRATVVEGVGGLIEAENDQEHGDYGDVDDNVGAGIETIDNYTARSYAVGGTVVRINQSSLSTQQGRLIRQTEGGSFENVSDHPEWQLASNTGGARRFVMTVDSGSLISSSESDAASDGAFAVEVSDGSTDWTMFVYRDGGVTVATKVGGNPTSEACSVGSGDTTIDLSAGTVDGDPCPGLEWADGVSQPYDIAFRDGNNATGTYNLTVEGATAVTTNLHDGSGDPTKPYRVPAVYSATFDVSYETPTLIYRSEVRVAPGEPE